MMPGTVKYLLGTPLKELIKDVREYSEIKSQLRVACKEFDQAGRGLVNNVGHCDDSLARLYVGCKIKYIKTTINQITGDEIPSFAEYNCPCFSLIFPCKKPGCAYGVHNARYFAMREKVAGLQRKKQYFWAYKVLRGRI